MLINPDSDSDALRRYDALPPELQLRDYLGLIVAEPTGWISVLRSQGTGTDYSSLLPILVETAHQHRILATTDWSINDLGVATYNADRVPAFDDGLVSDLDGYDLHFFAHVLWLPSGTAAPTIEFTPSFRWWLGLIPRLDETMYRINRAGRDEDVVRILRPAPGEYDVQVSARHLRKYLAVRGMSLIVQHSHSRTTTTRHGDRIDLVLHTKDAAFDYNARAFGAGHIAQLLGKQSVLPFITAGEDADDEQRPERYQSFVTGVDPATGAEVRLSCERDETKYLTPVFFDADVLTRYRENSTRYKVQRTDVRCHGRWMIEIDINDEGLVQVWLGDLVDLPESEREHWLTHNVPPSGGITLTRALRDLAGRWVEDERPDPERLRQARSALNSAFKDHFGEALYKTLGEEDGRDFESLALCTNSTEGQRDNSLLILSKGIVESLEVKTLRKISGEANNAPSIKCLQRIVEKLGGDTSELIDPLRQLQSLRSTGSAHMKGSNFAAALTTAGVASMTPDKQFERILHRVTDAVQGLAEFLVSGERREGPDTTSPLLQGDDDGKASR